MKIGDRIYVRGYINEIRKDTVIVRNDSGYFGTIPSEVITGELPSAQPDNQVNLCDSCTYQYPDCPSKPDDVIFGNGKGNDNICACNKYRPISAQPEREKGKWTHISDGYVDIYECNQCGDTEDYERNFCPDCGADMRQSNAD